MTNTTSSISAIYNQLIKMGWFQLPADDVSQWDEDLRYDEYSTNDWSAWAVEGEPVLLLVRQKPTVILGFDFIDGDRSEAEVLKEAFSVIQLATSGVAG